MQNARTSAPKWGTMRLMRARALPCSLAAVAIIVACGKTAPTAHEDAGRADASDDATSGDGSFTDSTTTPCGTARCEAVEYCIVPCVGGILPTCAPEGDDGCPSGTAPGHCLADAGPTFVGCAPVPPPPYCSPEPLCASGTGIREGKTIDCICP